MDEDGLIRIRGRLRRVCLPGATSNPIVLHPLLVLIQHHHLRTLHAGSQLIALLRHEFWILRAAPLFDPFFIRSLSAYHALKPNARRMGDLSARITLTACAFIHTSVDYAGPIAV